MKSFTKNLDIVMAWHKQTITLNYRNKGWCLKTYRDAETMDISTKTSKCFYYFNGVCLKSKRENTAVKYFKKGKLINNFKY